MQDRGTDPASCRVGASQVGKVPLVKASAIMLRVLAKAMYDYQGCLTRIIADPSADETVKYRAKKRLAGLGITQQRLHSVFLTDPERWLEAMVGPDPEATKDLLNLLGEHPDTVVREQAMRVLQRFKVPASSP